MPEAVLRRAVGSDAPAIAEVYLSSIHTAMPWLRLAHTDDDVRGWIAQHVIPDLETWVAEVDGLVAAMLAFNRATRFVDALYVAPAHQGRGLGGSLLQRAKELSPEGLQLWAFQRNHRARSFYEGRGFVAVELTDGSGNEEREPDVRYAWTPV